MATHVVQKKILALIRVYQRYLNLTNPVMRALTGTIAACRFSPTCSEYMYEAVEKHGIIAGLSLGIKRILRCHPMSRGGVDPVPNN
jgi:uncharacterized protein